jgi:hypothetical protein
MMRTSHHSHNIEQVPVYGALPSDITTSAPPYPTFPTAHHVDSTIDQHISNYGMSSPAEHQRSSNLPSPTNHNGMHLDPLNGRNDIPSSPPTSHHHEFSSHPPTPSRAVQAPQPPTPPDIPNSAPMGQFDMLPPPTSTHPSWQALHDYAQQHASAHGYALSINTTAKNRSRIKLACVCYGAPKNTHKLTPETRIRKNRVSYKTGCKMWIEGKKQEDGLWALIVGEPVHNHPGRAVEGWALQRKRTWGVQGGRVGVGGVTAKEEKERMHSIDNGLPVNEYQVQRPQHESQESSQKASHSLESGGLVWRVVEQEMLRKGGLGQGRDRGVGRTVKVLEERLPGIHIFKRDVYNIRAQIKRARKAAGQQVGEGLDDSDNEIEEEREVLDPEIDPNLVAQCNSALQNVKQHEENEVIRLRKEVEDLRQALIQRNKELEDKNSENESLKVQVEMAHMALYNERSGAPH